MCFAVQNDNIDIECCCVCYSAALFSFCLIWMLYFCQWKTGVTVMRTAIRSATKTNCKLHWLCMVWYVRLYVFAVYSHSLPIFLLNIRSAPPCSVARLHLLDHACVCGCGIHSMSLPTVVVTWHLYKLSSAKLERSLFIRTFILWILFYCFGFCFLFLLSNLTRVYYFKAGRFDICAQNCEGLENRRNLSFPQNSTEE